MKKSFICASCALALALPATAAKLDTQVISATGFKASLADVADNLYVLSREDIAEKGYTSLAEALRKAAGVDVNSGVMTPKIDIRGQGDKATEHVQLYVNGVLQNPVDNSHMGHPVNMINIDDVEQVEIIPGGGAVVYGGGAVGGVINVITKASMDKDFASVKLRYGSFNHFSGTANAGVRINDAVFFNIGAFATDEKGYQKADRNKIMGANIGAKLFFADHHSLALNARYAEDKQRLSNSLSEAELAEDRRAGGQNCAEYDARWQCIKHTPVSDEPLEKHTQLDVSANYSGDLDELKLSAMPFYSRYKHGDNSFENNRMGAKLRANLTTGALNSLAGYEFIRHQGKRASTRGHADVKKQTHAIYALESYEFSEEFKLSAGARYEHSSYDIARAAHNKATGGAGEWFEYDAKANDFAASMTASYEVADASRIYAKIERGFNSPDPYQRTDKELVNRVPTYVVNDLKTEEFMNYEIGYKGLIAEQFASLAVFMTDTKNEITYDMKPGMLWNFLNLAKTQRIGVEASLEQSFMDEKLKLYQNLAYIQAKVKNDGVASYKNGQKLPKVSPFSAAVGASYAFDLGLKIGADYRFYSKTNWNFAGKPKAGGGVVEQAERKAFGLLDLNASYEALKGLKIAAFAKNVLGEKYFHDVSVDADGASYKPAAKQSFMMEISYEY